MLKQMMIDSEFSRIAKLNMNPGGLLLHRFQGIGIWQVIR
jgi:hypothetical protein